MGQLPPAADVHLGIQTLEFLVRNQLRVCRRLQRLVLERALLFRGRADRDRKRVQNLAPCFSTSTKRSGIKHSSK